MKAKELMIFDLIKYKGRIVRVTAIDILVNSIRGVYVDNDEDTGWFIADEAEPIPLTEKILKANGFVDVKEAGFQRLKDDMCQRHLTLYLKDGMFCTGNPDKNEHVELINHITKVHELQRVLRCCGLWNLADNLKIKTS